MVLLSCQVVPHSFNLPVGETGKVKSTRGLGRRDAEKIDTDFKRLCESNRLEEAFQLFSSQYNPGLNVRPSSFGHLLQACSRVGFLEVGLQVHAHMVKRGVEFDQFLCANLVNFYVKCEGLDFARQVFDSGVARKNLVSWNSMIAGYCRLGPLDEALRLFSDLRVHGFEPDQFTFSVILDGIEQNNELFQGHQFHSLSVKIGYGEDEFVGNSLIKMYASCGRIDDSVRIFEQISQMSRPVTWNSMIARLVENGYLDDGLKLYRRMLETGIEPTPLTFSSVVKACTVLGAISEGEQVHAQLIIRGFSCNVILNTALVDLYVKCGELSNGRVVFEKMDVRSSFSWNSIIRGYSEMGHIEESLNLFRLMRTEGVTPDKFTFPALLLGVAGESYISEQFKTLHAYIIKIGLEVDPFIGSSLVSMYSTIQSFADAQLAFDDTNSTDVALWSSMISACVKNGREEEALRLFFIMLDMDITPNQFIYPSLFMACSNLSILEIGKRLHAYSLRRICQFDLAIENSLLTMYANCGCIKKARQVFHSIGSPSVISFNSMVLALAQHGFPTEASDLLQQMKFSGLIPDEITLLALLSAFNHAGFVNESLELFFSMKTNYGIEPNYQHYACIVDTLARAGRIEDAVEFINEMPFEPEPSLWQIMLGACSKHRNIEIGRMVAESLFELEPDSASTYILIANMYARSDRLAEADRVRHLMELKGLEKYIAVSWIENGGRTHIFRAEDSTHPLSKEIYEKLDELIKNIRQAGYVPDISYAVHDIGKNQREKSLYYHSEKLAFAFAILAACQGGPIRIMKNLRVCGDCHSAFKYFSLITRREIILRDNFRFHHFMMGACSCGDYW